MPIPIIYLELPSKDIAASKHFYGTLFGWTFEDFGPDYAAIHNSGLEAGFNAQHEAATPKAPLPVLLTDDLDAILLRLEAAGGVVTVPVFDFPGGRRFHFTDPSGQELAVMQSA